jgi:hypothetical protein
MLMLRKPCGPLNVSKETIFQSISDYRSSINIYSVVSPQKSREIRPKELSKISMLCKTIGIFRAQEAQRRY